MAGNVLEVHIDLGVMLGRLQMAVQRAVDLTAFGLVAAEQLPATQIVLPGSHFQLSPSKSTALTFDGARDEVRPWLLGCGLRDCIEAVNLFLDDVRQVLAVWSIPRDQLISGKTWMDLTLHGGRRFHRLGLPDKLAKLGRSFGPDVLPSAETESVKTINRARRCLVHRAGVVAPDDCAPGAEGLTVSWFRFELRAVAADGSSQLIEFGKTVIEKESTVQMRMAEAEKSFAIGDRVAFTTQEFSELCWTLVHFATQLTENVEHYARARGVRFTK